MNLVATQHCHAGRDVDTSADWVEEGRLFPRRNARFDIIIIVLATDSIDCLLVLGRGCGRRRRGTVGGGGRRRRRTQESR